MALSGQEKGVIDGSVSSAVTASSAVDSLAQLLLQDF